MVEVTFLGDIYLGHAPYVDAPFDNDINDIVSEIKSDYTIANLETAFYEAQFRSKKAPYLISDIDYLNNLKPLQINLFCLANNHVFDNSIEGISPTLKAVNEYGGLITGVKIDGIPINQKFEIDNIKFAILNYVNKDTNPIINDVSKKYTLNMYDPKLIVNEIRYFKDIVDHVIVAPHWGGEIEGGVYPTPKQINDARLFIDSGASLVIGHHSHTFHPIEKYKDKFIFYSIGNFYFPKIFNNGKYYIVDGNERKRSFIVRICFSKNSIVKYNIVPIKLLDNNVFIDKQRKIYWRNAFFRMIFSKKTKFWKFYHLYFIWISPLIAYLFNNDRSVVERISIFNIRKLIKWIFKTMK